MAAANLPETDRNRNAAGLFVRQSYFFSISAPSRDWQGWHATLFALSPRHFDKTDNGNGSQQKSWEYFPIVNLAQGGRNVPIKHTVGLTKDTRTYYTQK